jgi:hypothetical protein
MAAGWSLSNIRNKVRNLTGTDPDSLTDAQLNDYINNYVQYTMPFELKNQIQIKWIDFETKNGIDTYPFPVQGPFLTNSPDAYSDGLKMAYYQDPNVFLQDWPAIYNTDTPFIGNGILSGFTATTTANPIVVGSLIVADTNGTQIATDTGLGTFTGNISAAGSIDYVTGLYTVAFAMPVAAGIQVIAKYQSYTPTRPQAILFFEQMFTLRPIPDTVYAIRLEGFINPSGLTLDTDNPTQMEWGQCIAYGAAFDVFMDRGDKLAAQTMWEGLKRFETVALARTNQQYEAERSRPRF